MSIVVVDEEGGQPVQANGMKSSRRWMGLGLGSKDEGKNQAMQGMSEAAKKI